jgi:hypothetical protein
VVGARSSKNDNGSCVNGERGDIEGCEDGLRNDDGGG